MRIVAFSDPHGQLPAAAEIPNGDVLVIAGDLAPDFAGRAAAPQGTWLLGEFCKWLTPIAARFRHVLLTAGNHDFWLAAGNNGTVFQNALPENTFYGVDEGIIIDGVTFYLTPWVHNLPRWAFNCTEAELAEKLRYAPEKVDVLISHAPPHGYADQLFFTGEHVGSHAIREFVHQRKTRVVICGHIHEGYGMEQFDGDFPSPLVANVSRCDLRYRPVNPIAEIGLGKEEHR